MRGTGATALIVATVQARIGTVGGLGYTAREECGIRISKATCEVWDSNWSRLRARLRCVMHVVITHAIN